MLIDFEYTKKNLVLSYVNEKGQIRMKNYPWNNPFRWEVTDEEDRYKDPKYKTWDGKRIKQVYRQNPDRFSIFHYLDALPQEEQELIFGFHEPDLYFMDIETQIPEGGGFVEPEDATEPVTTIAIVHKGHVLLLGQKPLKKYQVEQIEKDINERFKNFDTRFTVKYRDYSNTDNPERHMLSFLFNKMIPKMPALSGWNFVRYDWTYLINRCRRIGVNILDSSFTGKLVKNARTGEELPMHRIIVDYMELFKKWDTSIKVRESYALDFVATKLLNVPKISYTGSLQDLYRRDFQHYLFYNAVDTILVQEIHRKSQCFNIMLAIADLARIRVLDSLSALRVTEGILREKMREEANIILCRDDTRVLPEIYHIEGGHVKDPAIRGLTKWVACYDFASLYPTTQRQNNIGPENYRGIKLPDEDIYADLSGTAPKRYALFEGRKIEISPKDIVCANGAVFTRDRSVTVEVLEYIYNQRKVFKKKMFTAKDELKALKSELAKLKSEV